jgi:sugar-specific transcriptional regulator TrmB
MEDFSDILGVPERDIHIIRLLNSLGAMPASSVASRLNMNRTTISSALRRLVERGLVFRIPKKNGSYFSSVEPREITRQAEKKIHEEKKKLKVLSMFIRNLEAERGNEKGKASVSFFEGNNGIISLFQKTLLLGAKQSAFLTLEKIPKKVKNYLMGEYVREKKKIGVESRVLIPKSRRAEKYKSLDIYANRQTRFIPEKTIFETEIILCEQSTVLIDFHTSIGVLIRSKSIAVTMHSTFELLWNSAE